jgi:hypothetical protein
MSCTPPRLFRSVHPVHQIFFQFQKLRPYTGIQIVRAPTNDTGFGFVSPRRAPQMFVVITIALSGWTAMPYSHARRHVCGTTTPLSCGATPPRSLPSLKSHDERPEERPEIAIKPGQICEFHEAKSLPILGLVAGVEWKAKGGHRILIDDEAGVRHGERSRIPHPLLAGVLHTPRMRASTC